MSFFRSGGSPFWLPPEAMNHHEGENEFPVLRRCETTFSCLHKQDEKILKNLQFDQKYASERQLEEIKEWVPQLLLSRPNEIVSFVWKHILYCQCQHYVRLPTQCVQKRTISSCTYFEHVHFHVIRIQLIVVRFNQRGRGWTRSFLTEFRSALLDHKEKKHLSLDFCLQIDRVENPKLRNLMNPLGWWLLPTEKNRFGFCPVASERILSLRTKKRKQDQTTTRMGTRKVLQRKS